MGRLNLNLTSLDLVTLNLASLDLVTLNIQDLIPRDYRGCLHYQIEYFLNNWIFFIYLNIFYMKRGQGNLENLIAALWQLVWIVIVVGCDKSSLLIPF